MIQKFDKRMLCEVQDQHVISREAMYHNACRRNYTRSWTRHASHEGSEACINKSVHIEAFKYICNCDEAHIVQGHHVERLTII